MITQAWQIQIQFESKTYRFSWRSDRRSSPCCKTYLFVSAEQDLASAIRRCSDFTSTSTRYSQTRQPLECPGAHLVPLRVEVAQHRQNAAVLGGVVHVLLEPRPSPARSSPNTRIMVSSDTTAFVQAIDAFACYQEVTHQPALPLINDSAEAETSQAETQTHNCATSRHSIDEVIQNGQHKIAFSERKV